MQLLDDPVRQFERWFGDAVDAGIAMPDAMSLATVGAGGRPSARMILFKGLIDEGFTFYTNYVSRKATELDSNPNAALVFHWLALERQVRVEGAVERLSAAQSDAYFATRTRGSRISAWASYQSRPYETRAELVGRLEAIQARFDEHDIQRPEFWGGYRLVPERIEFWKGQPDRFHHRVEYVRRGGTWAQRLLQP